MPEKKQSSVDYDIEQRMFMTGEPLKAFLGNQDKTTKTGVKIKKTPLKSPEHVISPTVRVSNNPDDTNVDLIIEKLMRNRSFHKDFDPVLGQEKVRFYIRDLML
jgi:hypothetical protein